LSKFPGGGIKRKTGGTGINPVAPETYQKKAALVNRQAGHGNHGSSVVKSEQQTGARIMIRTLKETGDAREREIDHPRQPYMEL